MLLTITLFIFNSSRIECELSHPSHFPDLHVLLPKDRPWSTVSTRLRGSLKSWICKGPIWALALSGNMTLSEVFGLTYSGFDTSHLMWRTEYGVQGGLTFFSLPRGPPYIHIQGEEEEEEGEKPIKEEQFNSGLVCGWPALSLPQ